MRALARTLALAVVVATLVAGCGKWEDPVAQAAKQADLYRIQAGDERYENPASVVYGG